MLDRAALIEQLRALQERYRQVVYAIGSPRGGLVKIGFTGDVLRRLVTLQAHSPEALIVLVTVPGGIETEAALHERFAEDRRHGEWFDRSVSLLRWIADARTESAQARCAYEHRLAFSRAMQRIRAMCPREVSDSVPRMEPEIRTEERDELREWAVAHSHARAAGRLRIPLPERAT